MRSVKNTSKVFVVLAALGLALAGCEQRSAETSGDSDTGASSGGMNPPASSGAGTEGAGGGTGGTGAAN